jgi:hypothetical protein
MGMDIEVFVAIIMAMTVVVYIAIIGLTSLLPPSVKLLLNIRVMLPCAQHQLSALEN